jgi:hypothetical protein
VYAGIGWVCWRTPQDVPEEVLTYLKISQAAVSSCVQSACTCDSTNACMFVAADITQIQPMSHIKWLPLT